MDSWKISAVLVVLFILAMLTQLVGGSSTGTWIGPLTTGAGAGRVAFMWLTALLGVAVFSLSFRK